jgi:glycosyltransferase involved in cell wall biosynthesis
LLYVGRLVEYKGLHLLLQGIRGLPGVELTVAGEGPFRSELEEMAVGSAVKFVGFRTSLGDLYEAAHVFVNPSMGPEGLPIVCLEAMSYGLACLFSDLPVHREIACGGSAAVLFNAGNPSDLRQKLVSLVSDEGARLRYGNLAHAAICARHNPELAAKAYAEAFLSTKLS